jgi:hypothetical protein
MLLSEYTSDDKMLQETYSQDSDSVHVKANLTNTHNLCHALLEAAQILQEMQSNGID